MRRITKELLDQLDFGSAVEEEAQTCRNQIPPEPWIPAILNQKHKVASWLQDRLAAGLVAMPNVVVNVRKSSFGTRPVPVMGIAERVVYRALTTHIVGRDRFPDRSAAAYKKFLFGPISHGLPNLAAWSTLETRIKYVVQADIAAFYQYIDHDILRRELELQTGRIDCIDLLMELLAEVQQRSFGIPQLVDASDWLSEVYINIVERDLIRQGWPVWRFNDDFRVGCLTYMDALDAIERLDTSARAAGLTISDYKTFVSKFTTYWSRTLGLNSTDDTTVGDPTDIPTDADVIAMDYEDIDDDPIEAAITILGRTRQDNLVSDKIDLKKIRGTEVRDIRRALNILRSQQDVSGLSYLMDILVFVPSLTPSVCSYVLAIDNSNVSARLTYTKLIKDIVDRVSLGEWQALWLTYVCRKLRLLDEESLRIWVVNQRDRGRGRPLGAEAALALAEAGEGDFSDLDQALRSEPEALAPWFLLGVKAMATEDPTKYRNRALAVRNSSQFNRIMLDI